MSVVLPVDLDQRALHRVPSDLIAAPLFATGLPMRGPAAWLDWRLCGLAGRAASRDPACAQPGSALLMPSLGRLRASWVLLGGAGDPASFGEHGARAWAADVALRCAELRIGTLAVALPTERVSRLALDRTIAALVAGVAAALAEHPAPLRLRLALALADMNRAENALAAAPRSYPGGVVLRVDRAPQEELPGTLASRTAAETALRVSPSASPV